MTIQYVCFSESGTSVISVDDKGDEELKKQFGDGFFKSCPDPGEIVYLYPKKESDFFVCIKAGFDQDTVETYFAKDVIGLHNLRKEVLPMLRDCKIVEFFEEAEDAAFDDKRLCEKAIPSNFFRNIEAIAHHFEDSM